MSEKREVFTAGVAVGYRAAELGHELRVAREGKRFRVVCTCGFATRLNATRKTVFAEALTHAAAAVNGEIPPGDSGVSETAVGGAR